MSLGEGGTLRVVGNNSVNFNLRERMTSFCFGTRGEGGGRIVTVRQPLPSMQVYVLRPPLRNAA